MRRQRWYFQTPDQTTAKPFEVTGNFYSNDAISLVHAALLGQGLVMFPTWLIADELKTGALVALLEYWRCEVMPGRRDLYVLTTERRLRSRKVRVFSPTCLSRWSLFRHGIFGVRNEYLLKALWKRNLGI